MNSQKMYSPCLIVILLVCLKLSAAKTVKSAEDCEVCVKFVDRFDKSLDDATRKSVPKIKTALLLDCKNRKGKDERFCYYIGGMETSATGLLLELAKPLSYHMPAEKICEKLSVKDEQICGLKYDKQIDFATANFKKMKVTQLKKILSDWDASCKGCTEKTDYVNKVLELLPRHAPEAAAARAKSEL